MLRSLWCCCLWWPLLELLGPLGLLGPSDPPGLLEALGLLALDRRASCLVLAE